MNVEAVGDEYELRCEPARGEAANLQSPQKIPIRTEGLVRGGCGAVHGICTHSKSSVYQPVCISVVNMAAVRLELERDARGAWVLEAVPAVGYVERPAASKSKVRIVLSPLSELILHRALVAQIRDESECRALEHPLRVR